MQESKKQGCFVSNGYMFCPYVVRNGVIITPKNAKYLRWHVGKKSSKKTKTKIKIKEKTTKSPASGKVVSSK